MTLIFFARDFRRNFLERWVGSPGFQHMLSKAVSSALKVDGTFGPMHLDTGLSVTTEGFTSTGWPGQAIGALDTGEATGWFEPWAVFRGKWQVNLIKIAKADFRLVQPDDALKAEDPVQPPKPWYAFLLPRQFFCRWISCPDMQIELPFGQALVRGSHLDVGATMIGKNFKYFGKNGTLHYPGYIDMEVDALEVYVTREMIDIGYLYLREPASPRSNIKLSGRLGQHADKSIAAAAEITDLDIVPFLPADLANILSGRLSGTISYNTDASGKQATGSGTLSLEEARVHHWDYLHGLAKRAADPTLGEARFREVSIDYSLADDVFAVRDLTILGQERFELRGRGSWDTKTSQADASLSVRRIPLSAYLPASLSGNIHGGELGGTVDWAWRGQDLGNGHGGGSLELGGARLQGFKFQHFFGRFLKADTYDVIEVSHGTSQWRQDAKGLLIHNLDILAPGQAGLRGWAHVAPDGALTGSVLAGLPESSLTWLPDATTTVFAHQDEGLHWCTIRLSGTVEKPENDFTAQAMRQLRRHPVAMARLAIRGLSWWLGDMIHTGTSD
ncbi:MAG: hypothetical protein IAE97_04225 [Chthoniobacterales bacterium]|nr:hypothetical protein [Chthoniobacterales bacterium]